MKDYEANLLYHFTQSKEFEPFKNKVKYGNSTAPDSEVSLELIRKDYKIPTNLRFYEDGSHGFTDCTLEEKQLLQQVYTAWLDYNQSFRGKFMKIVFKYLP